MIRHVSVSEIEDFLQDQWRWYARWKLNRVPRRFSVPLILGTMVHEIFALHFAELWSMEEAFAFTVGAWSRKGFPDPDEALAVARALKELEDYRLQIVSFKDAYPVDRTLSVEEAFEFPITNIRGVDWVLRGRPDRPIVVGGRVYHMQHKTVAKGKPLTTYAQFLSRSLHETLYGAYLRSAHAPLPYAGTIVNCVVKKKVKTPEEIHECMRQIVIPIKPFDLDRAYCRLIVTCEEMARAEGIAANAGIWALQDNPKLDDGPFHNSIDGYFDALTGKVSLNDPVAFMGRRETYAAED